MVTSLKGGVGKTTVTAGLSHALAGRGKNVIAIDMDFGVRGLDIALGMESYAAPSIVEWLEGTCELRNAALPVNEYLTFIAAPINEGGENLKTEPLNTCLLELKKHYDIVFLDMPAGGGHIFDTVSSCSAVTEALVVATHNENSLRAAQKVAGELTGKGISRIHLILNCFAPDKVREGEARPILETLFQVSVPLVGVVPYEPSADNLVHNQLLAPHDQNKICNGKRALDNIAARMCGKNIPLFKGIMKTKPRSRLF